MVMRGPTSREHHRGGAKVLFDTKAFSGGVGKDFMHTGLSFLPKGRRQMRESARRGGAAWSLSCLYPPQASSCLPGDG